ncbi:MAG: DUF1385 domain-containing protein [Anaerolineae bacterium]|nr:DUF1385 domain-containing protein [Anaerolineae bacterium]
MKFNYGGQAVIEGVMMRGAHSAAVAVRNPKGEVIIHETPLSRTLYRSRIIKTPFVRGVIGLWDALGLGTRALMWAADVAVGEDEEVDFNGPIGWATIAVSLVLGMGLFFLVPTLGAAGIGNLLGLTPNGSAPIGFNAFLVNLIEGAIQITLLVAYIWAIGRIPDVKRLFGYHGAEHKTINAYEAGAELTPEVVSQYAIEHPRCGTAFLLTVAFVSVVVFSVLGRPPLLLLILSRLIFIPVVAGIAYEVIQFSARNLHNPLVRILIKPNLALQHLTTRQPDLHMIEVAIVAFERVLVSEGMLEAEEAMIPLTRPEAVSPTLAASGD